jgi:hypothetical protein
MSTDNPNPEIESELLVAQVSYEEAVKIEDVEGKRVFRLRIPPLMQGHTFAVDMTEQSASSEPTGPFRIEYVLGTEFVIHEAEVPSSTFEAGYSHLTLAPGLERCEWSLRYCDRRAPELPTDAILVFEGAGGVLQRLVIKTEEVELSKAIHLTTQIVADLLDTFSLFKKVPISIRHIEVYADGKKFGRRYVTLPYSRRQLTVADVTEAMNIPGRLRGAVRLFREGLSSNRPPYRLLCLYRIREVINKVRSENDREFLERGGRPDRPSRVLPDNELTRWYFPHSIGFRGKALSPS